VERFPVERQPVKAAVQATREGRWDDAASIVRGLVEDEFELAVRAVTVSQDNYSLNSVNGFLVAVVRGAAAAEEEFFFKFHHEEGEEHTLEEFYRGELLKAAGYPVDVPVFASRAVGRQILLYRRRRNRRFADACRALEFGDSVQADSAVTAQARLDELTCALYLKTFHPSTAAFSAAEPIHQMFHRRLTGGRARRFFWGADFQIAGLRLTADTLRNAQWRINGILYQDSIDTLLTRSLELLHPLRLAGCGAVTAHGDAHNANVWWVDETTADTRGAAGDASASEHLTLFDPAFAGEHVPALLAEVKATFHNCLAHPFWLYDPEEAARRYFPRAQLSQGIIDVALDWHSSPLRERFLGAKADRVWRPLLSHMHAQGALGLDWRATLRCALFCCPALVMELRAAQGSSHQARGSNHQAGGSNHNPISSLIGLAVAVMAGSEPASEQGVDQVTHFLERITPSGDLTHAKPKFLVDR
jgi:hypothetical protein